MTSARRLVTLFSALLGALLWAAPADLPKPESGKLTVYYFDVGQGDAALIVSPTGKTILVDGGPPEAAESLAGKVRALTRGPLDLVILTHPHLDHLGGLSRVIRTVGARRYLDSEFDHPSSSYKELLDLVAAKEIPVVEAKPGERGEPFSLGIGDGAELKLYWPRRPAEPFFTGTRSDPNANSVVFRLSWGKTAFLFTGDSEAETEAKVMKEGVPLHATVLKVAHHGSRHSSQASFLARVSPQVAVISCGAHNDYGHPSAEALQRLDAVGAKVFRTDQVGDVEAVSDGAVVKIVTIARTGERTAAGTFPGRETGEVPPRVAAQESRNTADEGSPAIPARATSPGEVREAQAEVTHASAASPGGYAASRRSSVFHRADCPAVQRISPRNLEYFDDRASAAAGRRPAGDCHP